METIKQLTEKQLYPYLPDLKIKWDGDEKIFGITTEVEIDYKKNLYPLATLIYTIKQNKGWWKPILRPLSSITKEIEHNGERLVPIERLFEMWARNKKHDRHEYDIDIKPHFIYCTHPATAETLAISMNDIFQNSAWVVFKLFEWKFNVFNLPQELWIDVETLEVNPYKV